MLLNTLLNIVIDVDDLVFVFKVASEREVCSEDPVHRTLDDSVVSGQPAGTSHDYDDELGERRRRNGVSAHHRTPSVRRMSPVNRPSSFL